MSEHTPGPWWIDGACVVGEAGLIVQQAAAYDAAHDDLRLIAAAPELLEALIQAQSLFQQINRDDGDEFKNLSCDGMDLLEPLITKATGAQP